ncbi:MAG: glycosyltransferase family 2 protein [Armatimonadetes bacterium]|nr:glycosyltransferase family 2 protein [Armatimonadota bacterium]
MPEVTYSIVIPVFNEEKNIRPMYNKLMEVIPEECFEIIFVDDGSRDGTLSEIENLSAQDSRVKGISFSRNFGHQIALTAGYDLSMGRAVICLDGDLQHPVELIPQMIKKWKEGYEIVLTIREDPNKTPFFKRLTSKLYYRFFNFLTRIAIPQGAADFRLMDRKVVDALKSFREHHRFLRGIISWMGFNCTYLHYMAGKRKYGKSRYSLIKMFKLAVDGIFSFSSYPLKISSMFGYIISLFAFIYIIYALFAKFKFGTTISGWTSLIITVLFLGGIQLICIGIMGEYISRIYDETKNRPLYIINQKINFQEECRGKRGEEQSIANNR